MKKGLLATSALVGAGMLATGAASAAEAPEWKLGGEMNFQFYYIDQDWSMMEAETLDGVPVVFPEDDASLATVSQDHGWYFGVDEAELALNVKGAADNGLKYGFKIELQVNTTDTKVADEARIQLSGNWGTIQMGDEDGAEDIMMWGAENVMGGAGTFHYGDVAADTRSKMRLKATANNIDDGGTHTFFTPKGYILGAPDNSEIAGDTSDRTKLSYFSPRFSGFQVGASITPVIGGGDEGDEFKEDGTFENHFGLGANYVQDFGDLRIRAAAVYSGASRNNLAPAPTVSGWQFADISAWSVGGVIGWGPFDIGASYADNGDSGQPNVWDDGAGAFVDGNETSYWNVGASFKTGPFKFAAGYYVGTLEYAYGTVFDPTDGTGGDDAEFTQISLTADYTAAPGLTFYAEVTLTEDDPGIEDNEFTGWDPAPSTNSATAVVLGTLVKF